MKEKTEDWESELWSYLSRGDGTHCPIFQSCQSRLQGTRCFSNLDYNYDSLNKFIDNEDLSANSLTDAESVFSTCPRSGRIFTLVQRLAHKYQSDAGIECLPVRDDIVKCGYDHLPIEVRRIPLKANHGAVWRLSDCWIIHLNSNDPSARQRFTLYHEIFHILAHCKGTPVFRNMSCIGEGAFNEFLADHFSGIILTPHDWVFKMWLEVKDISKMAVIFDVPKSIMLLVLKHMGLI